MNKPATNMSIIVSKNFGDKDRSIIDFGGRVISNEILMLPPSPTKLRRNVFFILSNIGSRNYAIFYVESIKNIIIFSITGDLVFPSLSLDFFLRKQRLDVYSVYSWVQRDLTIKVSDEILVVTNEHLLSAFPVFFPEQ